MNYVLHLLIMIGIYLILSYGLNLVVGFGGLLSLCHAVFYGIGAYTGTLLMIKAGLPFLPAIFLGMVITGLFALIVGLPALRFRGDSFVLVTLGFQMIVFTILYNWIDLTRGPYGIPGIPRPVIAGVEVTELYQYFILVSLFLVVIVAILFVVCRSPFGLALKALRDDEMAAEGLGKSPVHLFLYAFVISGMVASLAGGLYATYVTYIDPTSFTLDESIFLLAILLVGGTGNMIGPLVGTVFMILLPEALRFLGLPDTVAPNVRQMIYGLTLITLMFLRPQGIAGEFKLR
ncbi:MAG: branched-chain amino acid ABC transporter permease [Deltaproteobacteria bacterium]|nr:MAG: branched-chain amino acid ABC transporter permease [Deltaproteobacteria bacterium]